jgi:hypothetical protein
LGLLREEKEKGETVSFKYWVKGGIDVGLVILGVTFLEKPFSLDFSKVTDTNLVAEDWRDEVSNDLASRWLIFKKIRLESGVGA